MTLLDVQKRINTIIEMSGDDEYAHRDEDNLHKAVLQAISDGTAEDPQRMAALALTTERIEFARWCA